MQNTIEFAKEIRRSTAECIFSIGSGHIGGCLSIADLLAVLYKKFMNVDPQNPKKADRDRFVLSKGHAGPALYATLALLGYFPYEWLKTLNKIGTRLPSHCHMGLTPGVDMTAGSLGQGLSAAAGLALGSKLKNDGASIYVVVGDGELQEGQNWEAAMYIGAKRLDNLIVFVDNNKMQIDGKTADIVNVEDIEQKFRAFRFFTQRVNGHEHGEIEQAIKNAKDSKFPSCIVLDTIKGFGIKAVEALGVSSHSAKIDQAMYSEILNELR